MFSYVAKSLLSKTLRTFLSSYLEDIQLDGINYGGENNTSSGWGVKLSNVKLREGMELMKLPGKRKRIVRKKKVKVKREQVPDVDTDLTPRVGNNSHKKVIQVADEQKSLPMQPGYDETFDDMDTQIIDIENTPQLPLHEKIQNRDRITSSDSADGYFSSDTGPSTPTQGNGLCGGRSSAFCNGGNSRQAAEHKVKEAVGKKLPLPSLDDEESNDITIDTPIEKEIDQRNVDPIEFSTPIEDDNNSYIEVEEEVEDEMALLVGAGGSIGTLNIRLVGKELHVTVEDAHLILEAVPNESDEEGDDTKSKAQKPSNIDRSTSSSSVNSETEISVADENNEVEPTIGEKVKKKSLLAKYLSMIPHLFLRDCRVSLILPEEAEKESPSDDIDDCTLFELGIDFLSVTSGDDFMDTLRFDTGNSNTTPIPKSKVLRRSSSMGSSIPEGKQRDNNQTTKKNIFARKRIRTGKGPDGGIWLTIKPPIAKMIQPPRTKEIWSRRRFIDTSESFFLRFSGLDLHARMLMRREDEVEIDNLDNEYEDYTLDSMLFGVDYIDPVSLNKHQVRKSMEARHLSKSLTDELVEIKNSTDKNGIESIRHPSNFHWIAQRQHRSQCINSHLPLRDCFECWNECVKDGRQEGQMDKLMPIPGFVLCVSITDPLEVNVDRNHLEALGYLKSLFTSKKEIVEEDDEPEQDETIHANDTTKAIYMKDNTAQSTFDDKSFPSYMTPDCIYLSGVYVSKLIIRVEAIQPRTSSTLKFRYWDFIGQSIHIEESQVDADEQLTRDMTFHIGKMECNDFIGVCSKHLVVAGVDLEPNNNDGVVSIPCVASSILGVPYPTTNIKTYALHARVIRSDFSACGKQASSKIGYVNLKMGTINVDIDSTLLSDASRVSNEAKSIVIGSMPKKKIKKSIPKPAKKDAVHWLYQISTVGGSISYQPRIKMKIPESTVRMRRGSEGISFETYLHKLGMEYGSYSFDKPQLPSILPLCLLPESLRMHILLYLDDDLTSLEKVLNIKKKKKASAFLRGHAVNKKLSKLGVASKKKIKVPVQTEEEVLRRNMILTKLKSLDTDSLVALLSIHDNKLHMN